MWRSKDRESQLEMPVWQHVKDLKHAACMALGIFLAAFGISVYHADELLQALIQLASRTGYTLAYLAPQEVLLQQIRVAFYEALVLALPAVFIFAYKFLRLALSRKEKAVMLSATVFGYAMFLAGVLFADRIALPMMLQFFIDINQGFCIQSTVSMEKFAGLVFSIYAVFGVIAEMPLICTILSLCGILHVRVMMRARKPAIVLIFAIAAVITPPDVVSQFLVAIPMVILYHVSMLLVWCCSIRKARKV